MAGTEVSKAHQKVTVRPMVEEDISEVLEIDRALVGEKRVLTYASPVESYIGGTLGTSWVAESAGRVVGFVLCRMVEPGPGTVGGACIELVGVHPDAQRQGVGRALVTKLMEHCREKGVQQISIMADRHDMVLRRFLTSLSFQQGDQVNYTLCLE
ncbi:MAG: GNAT family N-acetyltransferase [Chloroflexota bacterium]